MRHLLSLFYLAACITSFAQVDNEKKMSKKELIEQADYYFFKENFPKALELYDSILHNYPKNHYVIYHRYVSHHLTDGRGSDLAGLKEFEENEGHTDKFYNYWLGRIHYSRYEFHLAQKHFKAFLDLEIYRTREIIKESETRLKESKNANSFYLSPNDFEVELLSYPINSEYSDISPAFFSGHDELLFVSSRPTSANEEMVKNEFSIFHTKKNNSHEWGKPSVLDHLGKLTDQNTKIEVVNNDGRMFVYKENSDQGDLYFSEPGNSGWGGFKEFDSDLRNRKIKSHFFINDDETMVYFSSESNFGDLDLYVSKLDPTRRTWTDPIPVFGLINSTFNEDSPFLSHDEKAIYFSSNRPESIGGYDIFKSDWQEDTQSWGEPQNVGFPINTIDDEVNFQLNEDNISGFFSSNRIHGKGDFDIYHFHKQGKVLITGSVSDKLTGRKLNQITIDFKPVNNVDETFQTITNGTGGFEKELFQDEEFLVEFSFKGQLIQTERVTAGHDYLKKSFTRNFEITLPDVLEAQTDFLTLYDNSNIDPKYEQLGMLGSKFRVGQKAMLNNIYFNNKSSQLKKESMPILEELAAMMNTYKTLKIQVAGHTDNTGKKNSNQILSENRARRVKSYLVSQGIATQRIITKGYGSSQPIASNDDEKDGRELNRRIEVIVIE